MRKSRLKILPARCLAQLGFLLLYLACPILGEMSRAQPDHGLASSLTLHVLEHCASPPKDPGDGSCSPVPEDVMVMTRNENGHATCSVATHLLNLATKCASEDQPLSKQSSKVTTVTLVPRRLLAARSKLPASTQEPIKSLPKRQFRHRSLKRESDSPMIAEQNLVHFERLASRRSTNVARGSVEERKNVRTEVTRTISRVGSDNFRSTTSERLNPRYLNRESFRSVSSGDTNRAAQGESRRLRRASYSRVTPSDIKNRLKSSERSADKGRRSSSSAERRTHESLVADHRSRYMDIKRISLASFPERRMESRATNYESRRFASEGTLIQKDEKRTSPSRVHTLDSSTDRSYRRTLAERRLSISRATEIETRKSSRSLALQASRTDMREQLSQTRLAEVTLQSEELRKSVIDRKFHERRSSEERTRESRARQTLTVRERTSPDRSSFRSLLTDRESRRNLVERLSLQRSSTDRRLSESEGRISAEKRSFQRSTSEAMVLVSRTSRADTRRRLSESSRSSSPIRERYSSPRRLLGITRERQALGTPQQTLLRMISDERAASRSRDRKVTSRLIRENNIISGARRVRRSISSDRSDSNRAYLSRARSSLSMMNDRRDASTTVARIRNVAPRNLPAETRMPENSRQQRQNARRDMEGRSRASFRELSLSEVRERMRTSRERRTESPESFSERTRYSQKRSASLRTFNMERREVRKIRDQDHAIDRRSKDVTLMERRDIRRAVSDRSPSDRRFTFRAVSRSSDPLLTSRRRGERQRVTLDRSALDFFNFRSRSLERENRREISYKSSRRGSLEVRSLGRISREDSLGFLRFRHADSARNVGRRTSTIRTAVARDLTRAMDEHTISRLSRRASIEIHVSADERNTRRVSSFRSTMLQDTSRSLEQTYHNARAMRVRSMEREMNYISVERQDGQSMWVAERSSQRDDRFNRQLKAPSAGHFLRRNARAVSLHAIRRQSANRQNEPVLKQRREIQVETSQTLRNSRSSELRAYRRYMLSANRKLPLRDTRQSTDRLMSAAQYGGRATDFMRIARSSKSRNYVLTREQRENSNYIRFNRKAVFSQELSRKSQRYQVSAFRKITVYDNRLIASKTDNYRAPEITAKNITAKTAVVREAKVEVFNKYSSSWLKDLTTTCSMKWHAGALWQQIFLILATLSWNKTGCIHTITDKVSSYLFASENLDIFGATKIATSNDRDNLLGTVIGGGAAAAALLLFSTRTK